MEKVVDSKKGRGRILAAGMIIQFFAGILYMWSVFNKPVTEFLEGNLKDPALTASIMMVAFVLGIVLGGRVQDKIGPMKVTLAGSVIAGLGMILTSFVTPEIPWLIYVTYGVVSGFGVGIIYTASVAVVQKWFPDKRGFATGMMVGAFGASLVVFSPVATQLLNSKGVPFTFRVLGICFIAVCLPLSFLIKNPTVVSGGAAVATTQKQYTTGEMLKTGQFYLIAISMLLILPAYFILNPQFKSLAVKRGLSEDVALVLVMVTGVASALGRLFCSWISDKIGRRNAIFLVIGITMLSALMLTFAQGFLFLVFVAAIAFAFGGSSSIYPVLNAETFGTKHAGLNYGCVMVGFAFSSLVFPQVAKRLDAHFNNDASSFILAAATTVVAFVLVLMIKTGRKKKA